MAQNGDAGFGALLQGAGRQMLNQGGQALLNYGAQALGNIINEVFQKKETEQKRFLPSIKNYKVLGETRPSSFGPASYQDFKEIRSRCLADGRLFEDPEFPATDRSLLHGSYEALKGGSTCEAMEDFTGGVTEMYEMNELPPNFYTILLKAYERNSLMGCSIEPDPNVLEAETPVGLIRGHAYSVTRVKVEICNLNPDSLDPEECPEGCTKKWEMSVFEGEWVRGVTAGGCRNYLETFWKNPQYTVTLKDVDEGDDENKCTKNRRSQRHQGLECLTIGFAVYRLPDYGHVPKPLDVNYFKYNASVGRSQAFINLREVSARFKFEPGSYVIVPSTFEPDEEGEFLLRVFSEKSNNMTENDEDVGMGDVDERFFERLAGSDGEVDWQELKEILDYAMREEMAMRHGAAYDGGGGVTSSTPQSEQGCLEQLLCALCTPICKEFGVDLQQIAGQNQEQVHLTQPQPAQETFEGRSSGGDYATFSLDEWLNRTVYS
ncbi:unnamed protein product [Leptidea sinapis]|uniref:Calpain catalytic domain-containing protein n=1 Tax=Leptidea sinapis TaxID=189913 RepID=A0A5E4QU67_9NEOP|nr:unnamed protein product [Leptidea sinapis]